MASNYKNSTNIASFVRQLLFTDVDRPVLVGLTTALLDGVIWLYSIKFQAFYKVSELDLEITPQVWSLNKHLNATFLNDGNLIYIEDGIQYPSQYLYLTAEEKPLETYLRTEETPFHVGLRSENGYQSVSFNVRIPAELVPQKPAITAWVNKYKLAGKSFSVLEI